MPRRILLLVTDLEIGGTPTVIRELATRLHAPPNVCVEVACLSHWGPVASEIAAAGVSVTPLNAHGLQSLPHLVGKLARLLHDRKIDTLFSFLVHANLVAALAAGFAPGVRCLQSIQTTQPNPRWHWRVQRAIQIAADAVVVPSPSARGSPANGRARRPSASL